MMTRKTVQHATLAHDPINNADYSHLGSTLE